MGKDLEQANKKMAWKFLALLALLLGYFAYLSITHDVRTGGVASLLTWSFFVLCTPIADAGFLLDFPLRLLFNIRMLWSELVVWSLALASSIAVLFLGPDYFNTTGLTKVFYVILTTPYPYWSVIIVSTMGTFLSIYFGDRVLDMLCHKNKYLAVKNSRYEGIAILMIFAVIFITYYKLIIFLGLDKIIAGHG